jgi:hypothetical protein
MVSLSLRTFVTAAIMLLIASGAEAATVTFSLGIEYSGGTEPEGTPPWLTATFDDGGSPGSVDLTLETTNLTDAEFVFEWSFNFDPSLDPTALAFSEPVKTGAFTNPKINLGVDAFQADGDGSFDIQVEFDNSDGAPSRFGVGDAVEYTIWGPLTLTASWFDFPSATGGGQGMFPTAAHVGAIGPSNSGSGWISVPEPATLAALAAGLLYVVPRRRR